MDRPRHERPVGPEPAVGDQEVQVRMIWLSIDLPPSSAAAADVYRAA